MIEYFKNMVILKDLKSLKKSSEKLKDSKKIVLMNLNYQSLELFKTLKELYPDKEYLILNT